MSRASSSTCPPNRKTIVVAGAETHVCVLQTVLGLRERGYDVAVVSDAVGSRYAADKEAGLRRMAAHGAEIVTAEMVAFEWLDTSDHPDFKAVIGLVKGLLELPLSSRRSAARRPRAERDPVDE